SQSEAPTSQQQAPCSPSAATISRAASAKRTRGSDSGSTSTVTKRRKQVARISGGVDLQVEEAEEDNSEGMEDVDAEDEDSTFEAPVEVSLRKKVRRAKERAAAAEEERKVADERSRLIEKQLADMQTMLATLQQQMLMQSSSSPLLSPGPPSSPPYQPSFVSHDASSGTQQGVWTFGQVAGPHHSEKAAGRFAGEESPTQPILRPNTPGR